MTEPLMRSVAWMLQQGSALPDTLVMKTVGAERGWFETVAGIASGVLAITLVVLTIVVAPAAWSFWKTFRKARALLDRVYADITPLTRRAENIADNLEYITTSIRHDVQQVNATIASANRRLTQAVGLTETGLNEFNALLHVVQEEAEQAFVSTASTVRGVRTGAATLSSSDDPGAEDGRGGDDNDDDSESDEDTLDEPKRPGTRHPATRPRLRSKRPRRA